MVYDYMGEGTLQDYLRKFELSFDDIVQIYCQVLKCYKEVLKVWFIVPEWRCKNLFKQKNRFILGDF